METYTALRHFADSWGLVLMFVAFALAALWLFRPGARKAQDEAANLIFRNEDAPKDEDEDEDHGR